MQFLNQQNSQLYIYIPQLNTLGHPLEGPIPKPYLIETKCYPGSWPKLPSNSHFTGLLGLILNQNTETTVGKEILSGQSLLALLLYLCSISKPCSPRHIPSRSPPHRTKTLKEAQGCSIQG